METKPVTVAQATPPEPMPEQEKATDTSSEEVTAEFNTEDVKNEVKAIESKKTDLKSWVPVIVGLITMAAMTAYAYRFWLPK